MGLYEDFIYVRSYSRWIPELKRRETYVETVDRFCNFIFNETRNCNKIPSKTKKRIRELILNLEIAPSMRLMWSAGENVKRDNIAAYNCAAMAMHSLECFGEMMYILLAGAGCGYSVEDRYVSKLPVIKKQKNRDPLHFVIPDTKLGWKQAIDFGVSAWVDGRDAVFGYEKIRPAGTPLVVSGGYASGSAALQRCLEFLRETFINAQERQLEPLEVSDINNEIGNSVICGGVRRSSEACLSDVDDLTMRDSKQGNFNPRRFMANISGVYRKKPNVLDFAQEFINMGRSGSGERGIYNLAAIRKRSPKRRDKSLIILTNPCFTYESLLLTDQGYCQIGDLCDQEVNLINRRGEVSTGKVWHSGVKEVVKISFCGDISEPIRCTPDHEFMLNDESSCKAVDLIGKRPMPFIDIKDSFDSEEFLAGFIQGDGSTGRLVQSSHRGMEVQFGEKDEDIAKMYGQPIGQWRSREVYDIAVKYNLSPNILPSRELPPREFMSPSFLSGLFSANGCVIKKYRVAIKSTCYNMLTQLQSLLKDWFDIDSYITTNKPTKVDFSNGTYLCKESYDLNIGRYRSIKLFAHHISFGHRYKREALRDLLTFRSPVVAHVVSDGVENVYDFSEPKTNWGIVGGYVVHNCFETALRDMQCCNLSEAVVRAADDFDDMVNKIKAVSWLGAIQSTLSYFPVLRPEWTKNAEEERLMGVSITGLCDNMDLITPETLRHWRRIATKTAEEASKVLDINMPAAITLLKPSGTVSQRVDCSSGLHSRWAKFYIRRVRISMHDSLFKTMVDQGMPYELDKGNHDTAVFSFPIKSPEGAKLREQDTAIGQLEWYKMIVSNFCDQNASCTIYIKDEEWIETMDYIYRNWDTISGVSFFPYSNKKYDQPPYEEIDELTYKRMLNAMPEIDLTRLCEFEDTDNTEGASTLACSGNACEL
jgi:hypothetical protein